MACTITSIVNNKIGRSGRMDKMMSAADCKGRSKAGLEGGPAYLLKLT